MSRERVQDDKLNYSHSFSVSHEEELLNKTQKSEVDKHQSASPLVWVPLSLLVAIIYAVGNITISYISHYEFKARYLQAPGNTIGNLIPLMILTYNERFGNKMETKQNQQVEHENQVKSQDTYFRWLRDLYYVDEQDENGNVTSKFIWARLWLSVSLMIIASITITLFFMSYNYASKANLNNGIIMALYSLKPIYTSILFYWVFSQSLKWFEFIGIGL